MNESIIIFIIFVMGVIILTMEFIVEELEKEVYIDEETIYIVKRKYLSFLERDYKYFSYLDEKTYYSDRLKSLYVNGLIRKKII